MFSELSSTGVLGVVFVVLFIAVGLWGYRFR